MLSDGLFLSKIGGGKCEKWRLCEFLWGLWVENWSFGRNKLLSLINILLLCIVSNVSEKQNVKYGKDNRADDY